MQGNHSQVAPASSPYARSWCAKLGALKALAFLCMITTRRVLLKSERLCKLSSILYQDEVAGLSWSLQW
jgi:hypothetical protein